MNNVASAREALGWRLRELRRTARLTGRQLAESLHWPQSKVSKLELGQQTPSEGDIRAWVEATHGRDQLGDLLGSLNTLQTQYAEWRRQFRSGTARRQRELLQLAARTKVTCAFEPVVVPGLLQTAGYAHHMLADIPELYDAPNDIEQGVVERLRRQEILYQPGKQFHFVITEAVLRYQLCPTEVMAGQLDRLLAVLSMPNMRLGIIPFAAAYPTAPLHGFWIYDNQVVLVETFSAELNLAQPHELQLYSKLYSRLAHAAVYTAAARSLVLGAIAELPAPLDTLPLAGPGNS
ncbi:MAG: helix-turn-helix domain-containing protein [Sporichthyaceae bacterium]|nr:helix-turn-helix domain-containing protein [Sporichthyaceae bacterium]